MCEAEYLFEKYLETRYILREHTGIDISDFPAVWKQKGHPKRWEKYVVVTAYYGKQSILSGRLFTHRFSFGDKDICFNFTDNCLQRGYGEYLDFEVLAQFSDGIKNLSVQFIKKEEADSSIVIT